MPWAGLHAEFVVAAVEVLDERVSGTDHSWRAQPFQTAHRPQPCRQTPMISFDGVVRVLLHNMTCSVSGTIDQYGQVIDMLVSETRDLATTRRFFIGALGQGLRTTEVTTDQAPAYLRAIQELIPAACHVTEQYANNLVEADHGRLKARLRPMRGLKRLRSTRVISAGQAFVQNLRRGHYELGVDIDQRHRLTAIFAELSRAL
jgi:IS6 family transposase